jgi:hypothetical protein
VLGGASTVTELLFFPMLNIAASDPEQLANPEVMNLAIPAAKVCA